MNSHITENEIIASCLKELKLPAIKDLLEDTIADATEQNWSFRKFLCTLLMREMEQRVENRKDQRIRKDEQDWRIHSASTISGQTYGFLSQSTPGSVAFERFACVSAPLPPDARL